MVTNSSNESGYTIAPFNLMKANKFDINREILMHSLSNEKVRTQF